MDTQFSKANIFNDVKMVEFPRHEFDQSFTNSLTMDHGYLVPTLVDYLKPGDLIDVHSYGRVQLTPLATSSMQNIKFYTRYFYVPFRLLWHKWDEYISQDGFVQTPILAPYLHLLGPEINSMYRSKDSILSARLLDYLNINLDNYDPSSDFINYDASAQVCFNLFSVLAYNLIWDTYFRDENLQNEVFDIDTVKSGRNTLNDLLSLRVLPVAKEKDYFTTALPWTQKGQPITLSTNLTGVASGVLRNPSGYFTDSSPSVVPAEWVKVRDLNNSIITNDVFLKGSVSDVTPAGVALSDPRVTIDTTSLSTSITINELRYANALQRYLERLALGGNRPAEFYLSMYGVQVDDLRIGQPKYLGGGSSYIHVTSIPQTSESSTTPQGTLAGNGQASLDTRFNEPYYCQEFGVLMGVSYIKPELNYSQGLPRMYQLFEHLDWYNPIFAHLGEEEVRKSELMLKSDFYNAPTCPEDNNDDVFGYQSRYAYLKGKRNEIHGDLKTTLRDWMLSEQFLSPPTLNASFVLQPQNYDIFAVTYTDHYIVEIRHDYKMVSNMPDFAIPSL